MSKWKVILIVSAVFVAGTVTGAVLTLRVVKEAASRNLSPERWPASLLETYARRLKLTPEQIDKMRPVAEEGRREWADTMRGAIRSNLGIIRRIDEELTPLLTPEQREAQVKLRQEMREKLRQRFNLKHLPESE